MDAPVIAFIERKTLFSGKMVSTKNLVKGIQEIGLSAVIEESVDDCAQAEFYAATCLEDADLLANVPPEKRIIWLRGSPAAPRSINVPSGGGRWIATSTLQAERRRLQFGEIFVLPEAIRLPPMSDVRAVDPEQRSGLLFVGRVERRKGAALLFNTLKYLPPGERLTVIGPVINQIDRLAETMGVKDRINFLGYIDNSELRSHYLAAKFLLAPCRDEPFGMPVVEALAHGCTPIAVAGSGGPDETLAGTPYLVSPSPEAFARAVLNGVQMPVEKARSMALHSSHRVVAQHFLEFLYG